VGVVSSRTPSVLPGSVLMCHLILTSDHSKDIDHCPRAEDDDLVKISHLAVGSRVHPLVHTVASAIKDSSRIQ